MVYRFFDGDFPLSDRIITSATTADAARIATGTNARFGCASATPIDVGAGTITASVDTTVVTNAVNNLTAGNQVTGEFDTDAASEEEVFPNSGTAGKVDESGFAFEAFQTDEMAPFVQLTAAATINGVDFAGGAATNANVYVAASSSTTFAANRGMALGDAGLLNWPGFDLDEISS